MNRDRRQLSVYVYLGLGLTAGIVYAIIDRLFDIELVRGQLGALAPVHEIFDHVLPVLTGGLLGAVLFAARQRQRLVDWERQRAEMLRLRVDKIERDQAVWVLAATVLHDVKNPLHALGLLIEELAASRAGPPALIDRAQAQIARISEALTRLRPLQRREQTETEPVRLDELVSAVARDRLPSAPDVRVHAAEPLIVVGDVSRIRLILDNLLENALFAGRAGGDPRVELSVEREGEEGVVRVRDRGAGPSEEIAAQMFGPLRSTKPHGLGLGLAVSRALAQAMSGDLRYEGRVNDWTTFRLSLPLEPS